MLSRASKVMQPDSRKMAGDLKATTCFLLGLLFVFPFALPINVSAQNQPLIGSHENHLNQAAVRLAQTIRSDAGRAVAADDLLIADRSLSELSDDLKLTRTDSFGASLEHAVLPDGFRLTNGHMLSNGFLFANGLLLTDGSVWPDGHRLSNSYAAGAECLARLACKDDTAIFGVRYITSSSSLFSRQR